jgi:hypothetical protein
VPEVLRIAAGLEPVRLDHRGGLLEVARHPGRDVAPLPNETASPPASRDHPTSSDRSGRTVLTSSTRPERASAASTARSSSSNSASSKGLAPVGRRRTG